MSDQFVAEIRIFAFNFPPVGWAFCNGQIMAIAQNTALFSLLGTTYGGDGKSTFALPNLQGSSPLQQGQGPGLSLYALGEETGSTNVTLIQTEMPAHSHAFNAVSGLAERSNPSNNLYATADGENLYVSSPAGLTMMNPQMTNVAGTSFPHNNMMPYLTLNFCIALQGIFPPRG
ncbi:MAG: tail fiber protein [Anaerolineae bacterium]|jgi:microcystin-dependent protein|nr:tail fiber protein [Anaerolineae bacterium]